MTCACVHQVMPQLLYRLRVDENTQVVAAPTSAPRTDGAGSEGSGGAAVEAVGLGVEPIPSVIFSNRKKEVRSHSALMRRFLLRGTAQMT